MSGSSNRYDTCSHLEGRCAVPKRKGSLFCKHHCCPQCYGDKSSSAQMCATCARDMSHPQSAPIRQFSGPGSPPTPISPPSNLIPIPLEPPIGANPSYGSGIKRFQDAAQRVSQQNGLARQGGLAGGMNVTPQDAPDLRVMLQKGALTPEEYRSKMAQVQQQAAQMFERPTNTPKGTAEIAWPSKALFQNKNFEMVYKYSYDYPERKWNKCVIIVNIERTPFAEGNLRRSYKMKDFTKPDGLDLYVAKASKDKYEDISTYFLDIEMQAMCQALAEQYNRRQPPKKVQFIDAFLIECFQQAGSPIFACEPYIEGKYVKYSNNWGFVSSHDRNTPHAFSHFTHHISGGKYIVVDVQGVGDKYTDPQVHSFDGKGFGKGNCGSEGISKFFATHKCNVLCKMLGLAEEIQSTTGTMAPAFAPKKKLYGDTPTTADLSYLGVTEQEYRMLVQQFRAVDKNRVGEIGLTELAQLCQILNLKISPNDYVNLLQSADRDGNGRISLSEFLQWWAGHCGCLKAA